MKIAVLGANGRVGQKVVGLLVEDGHSVNAFVHGNNPFDGLQKVSVVKGSVSDVNKLSQCIEGCDAVISTLGSWGTKSKNTLSVGMKNVIPLMKQGQVRRIISLTGAGATYKNDIYFTNFSKLNRLALKVLAGRILTDGELHIGLLQDSGLEWTVIRSPIMKDKPEQDYRLTTENPKPWETVCRDSVARSMVNQLSDRDWLRQAPFIRDALK